MSQLALSPELIEKLQTVLVEQDERAQGMEVAAQYLTAAVALMVANVDAPRDERVEFLRQLGQFSLHVFNDVDRPEPPRQEAFGIWRPKG